MNDAPLPEAAPEPAPHRGIRWQVGTVIALLGLLAFAVLGVVIVVGIFRDVHAVDLFPWMLTALAVGVLGMVLAGAPSSHGTAEGGDEDEDGPVDA